MDEDELQRRMLANVRKWHDSIETPEPPSAHTLARLAELRESELRRDAASKRTQRRKVPLGAWAAAVVICVALAGAATLRAWHSATTIPLAGIEFASGESETAPVLLNDGTRIELGPKSRLRVLPSATAREVWLDGQADFAVVHNPVRPFHVRTRTGDAEDLGTRFVVRTDAEAMQVAVFEGSVALSGSGPGVELRAGDLGIVGADRLPKIVSHHESHAAGDWLRASLVFEATPMSEVAARLESRYHVRVRVADSVVARRTVTAWFRQPPSLHDALTAACRAVGARCVLTDSEAVIRSRQP